MKIGQNILAILDQCEIKDNTVFLPPTQLDRKTYQDVNKCLELIGGKWNRKAKGHVFAEDPTEMFDSLITTGEVEDLKKKYQFFETPKDLIIRMIGLAELDSLDKETEAILEPSAGLGAIADEIQATGHFVRCCELDPVKVEKLIEKGYAVVSGDFLLHDWEGFDRIIMNPPFSKQQDIDHIMRAYQILRPSGILVAICGEGAFFRENIKSVQFRHLLEERNAYIEELEPGTFKESGTMVKARLIKLIK